MICVHGAITRRTSAKKPRMDELGALRSSDWKTTMTCTSCGMYSWKRRISSSLTFWCRSSSARFSSTKTTSRKCSYQCHASWLSWMKGKDCVPSTGPTWRTSTSEEPKNENSMRCWLKESKRRWKRVSHPTRNWPWQTPRSNNWSKGAPNLSKISLKRLAPLSLQPLPNLIKPWLLWSKMLIWTSWPKLRFTWVKKTSLRCTWAIGHSWTCDREGRSWATSNHRGPSTPSKSSSRSFLPSAGRWTAKSSKVATRTPSWPNHWSRARKTHSKSNLSRLHSDYLCLPESTFLDFNHLHSAKMTKKTFLCSVFNNWWKI